MTLLGDEVIGGATRAEIRRNCARLRGFVRGLRGRQRTTQLVFLFASQIQCGLCAKVERPHDDQSACSAVTASDRLPVVSAD